MPALSVYPPGVAEAEYDEGFVDRLSRQGEEALGKVVEQVLANPAVAGALSRALEAREKAVQAQEAAMGALGIPSAADIERLTRRLRSVSQRLEGIEDSLDRLDERLDAIDRRISDAGGEALERSLGELRDRLDEVARDIAGLRDVVAPAADPPPRAQGRLTVSEA